MVIVLELWEDSIQNTEENNLILRRKLNCVEKAN
jgi:hypothetical protein